MQQNNNPDVSLESIAINNTANVDTVDGSNITREMIKSNPKLLGVLIKEFLSSIDYAEMLEVDKYYESQNSKITERTKQMMLYEEKEKIIDGKKIKEHYPYLAPDLGKANHKLAHGYLYELINQCKNYLVGNPVKTEYDKKISQDTIDFIDDILYKYNDWGKYNQENVKNAQKYKEAWSRIVIDDKGNLRLLNVDSKQVIPFRNDFEELTCLIYIYTKSIYDKNGKKKIVKYAEVFDDKYKDVYKCDKGTQYTLVEENVPLLRKITQFGNEIPNEEVEVPFETFEELSWGQIPWVSWKYNEDNIDALQPIRCFIDILDIDLSDLANNIDDIQDAIWILENYQGQSIKQFMEDLKVKKAINVGEGGKADAKTIDIPTEAREKLYDKCEKNIYRFGRGINFADRDNLGNASGVALKWSYGPLDEKADELEENGQAALNDLFNLIFVYLKLVGVYSDEHDSNDVKFIFDRHMITNEKEQVEMVMASTDIISRKTALSHHPFVEDAEEEMEQLDEDASEVEEEVVDNVDDDGTEETEQDVEETERQDGTNDSKQNNKAVQK